MTIFRFKNGIFNRIFRPALIGAIGVIFFLTSQSELGLAHESQACPNFQGIYGVTREDGVIDARQLVQTGCKKIRLATQLRILKPKITIETEAADLVLDDQVRPACKFCPDFLRAKIENDVLKIMRFHAKSDPCPELIEYQLTPQGDLEMRFEIRCPDPVSRWSLTLKKVE